MNIERVIVKNYRTLRKVDISLRPNLNIIVGDNESGKSTLLEAINLALKCQLNRRPAAYELHPFLFNDKTVAEFIKNHKEGTPVPPPRILIELYFVNLPELADLKGSINSQMIDTPGVSFEIRLDEENFAEEYREYISDPDRLNSIPIEFYRVIWQSFAGHPVNARSMPVHSAMIDPSSISNTYAANKYVLEIVRDYLTKKQQVDLALSYRNMREIFLSDESVVTINKELEAKKGIVSDKRLSVAMDTTTRASWETGVLPYLDDIPLTLVGKGEQNMVKIKLAIEADGACHIFLMEEPENHLSHSNLNRLIAHLADKATGKQFIITTHSSFVLNKLGVENTLMFNGVNAVSLGDLPDSTQSYFKKLPGHNTLRMVLATGTILVEGPSDELIIQKAFYQVHKRMPLEKGVEVISVNSLAFKRFLDIAQLLKINVRVVTDNDGNPDAVTQKYAAYDASPSIKICFSKDKALTTLEPHLLATNGRDKLNIILGKTFEDDQSLLDHMLNNKADCALKIFDSDEEISVPDYISDAIG